MLKLHVTLLWVMGWQGGHFHEFVINGVHYGELDPEYPEPDLKNEQRVRLKKALGGAHTFDYLYDYGDTEDFHEVMANPSHPEYANMRQWYSGPFDPTAFRPHEVNQRLMEIQL